MKKQFLAKLLAMALVLSMVPVSVLAASAASDSGKAGVNGGYYYVAPDTTVRVDDEVPADGVIEVKVVNGTASATLNAKAVESLADLAENGEIVLEMNDEGASKINYAFNAKALTAVASETSADFVLKSSVATVTIPNEALSAGLGNGTLRISAQNNANGVSFSIQAGGKALTGIKGLQVTF